VNVRETEIADLYIVSYERYVDERGSFGRVYDRDVFARHGLCTEYPQHGVAVNTGLGTVRGLHYQTTPFAECKLIRCSRGNVWDVIVDVRPASSTFGRWCAFELDEDTLDMLYVGAGLAHGYQTLTERADMHYLISAEHSPAHAAGVHWRDPELGIPWPREVTLISSRDEALPSFDTLRGSNPA
jgi:dTDP-4-dehydrorhamnose 3,5-epimerase